MDTLEWNLLIHCIETESFAEEGDLITEIDGVVFLVQRRNDYNNIICQRRSDSKNSFLHTMKEFKKYLLDNDIHFVRVEGSKRRYNFLPKMSDLLNISVVKDTSVKNRNVFYIKLEEL